MKIVKGDKVMVIAGRNRGVQGSVLAVLPKKNQVVVEGVNVAKRHTKPSASNPKGGILELTRPIDVSKVMAIDPKSGKPARIASISDGGIQAPSGGSVGVPRSST